MIFLSSDRARTMPVCVCDGWRVEREGLSSHGQGQCSLEVAVTSLICGVIAHVPKAGAVVNRRIKRSLEENQQMTEVCSAGREGPGQVPLQSGASAAGGTWRVLPLDGSWELAGEVKISWGCAAASHVRKGA